MNVGRHSLDRSSIQACILSPGTTRKLAQIRNSILVEDVVAVLINTDGLKMMEAKYGNSISNAELSC